MLLGFILGQIRTLQRLAWLANLAIWLNVIVIIMTQDSFNSDTYFQKELVDGKTTEWLWFINIPQTIPPR